MLPSSLPSSSLSSPSPYLPYTASPCKDGSLEQFPQNAVLAYLSDGHRLTNENVRDLAGAQDDVSPLLIFLMLSTHRLPDNKTIYVFNKFYLDYDLHEVLRELRVWSRLQPQTEGKHSTLQCHHLLIVLQIHPY